MCCQLMFIWVCTGDLTLFKFVSSSLSSSYETHHFYDGTIWLLNSFTSSVFQMHFKKSILHEKRVPLENIFLLKLRFINEFHNFSYFTAYLPSYSKSPTAIDHSIAVQSHLTQWGQLVYIFFEYLPGPRISWAPLVRFLLKSKKKSTENFNVEKSDSRTFLNNQK